MVELIPTYFINKTKNILPLDILCKRATLQTPYHAFPVSPGLNDDGASNVVEDKNEFITSESYQPCWWFSSEGEAKEGDEGCGAVHQDSCLRRRYYFWQRSHGGAVYPPGHQGPEQHGDEEAEGVAGHDEGAGGGNVDCLRGHWSPTWWCRAGRGGRSPRQRWELRPSCCPRCVQWQTFFPGLCFQMFYIWKFEGEPSNKEEHCWWRKTNQEKAWWWFQLFSVKVFSTKQSNWETCRHQDAIQHHA